MTQNKDIQRYLQEFIDNYNANLGIVTLATHSSMIQLLKAFSGIDAFSSEVHDIELNQNSLKSRPLLRKLKGAFAMPIKQLFTTLLELAELSDQSYIPKWKELAARAEASEEADKSVIQLLRKNKNNSETEKLLEHLEQEHPHAIYPTSAYRSSTGEVNSTKDGTFIEAVMTQSTMTQIHIEEGILDIENLTLARLYRPLGRVVAVIDSTINEHYRTQLETYFEYHTIKFEPLVYRAMEIDKGIHMVEVLLADFKNVGVARQEPVLVVGGGVIADIGGLACALYHRNTPYVMLATSIVSGIDAGPSPRTCCDGFGFKNLFGAYHAPVMTLTDRSFFKTLRTGWIRHGIAEIIKMAVVKDIELFELLEKTGIALLHSQFGTQTNDDQLSEDGQKILALAMRSYVEAEYGNLYETHQCRPHAYGHTWSPGFEIPSGMLHGHAISCGMGFGAFLSFRKGWIAKEDCDRIMQLLSDFELSLWHDILNDSDLIYKAQVKVIEKRGGNLVAPLPKHTIGQCGYLNDLSHEELTNYLSEYKILCHSYERNGIGIEPLCSDVGLEDPSTVAETTRQQLQLEKVNI
ncbi:sedoheptulose 7-phosphate cyclase [Aquimarina sp. U1-2]|uniref:sedoheptulose 7-phosphate cyclase n=1 Tax=Aquimarina sp. U1-2 TaxID=2823141 RepID=UPI001AEC9005|nr:sedoheptulose 7-phosphate cyclase [Aquimarina sp. U1-2]MBP2832039.1 sedoheptulose 7-phosphate cyclase [Aquimarina sp. U1-2]